MSITAAPADRVASVVPFRARRLLLVDDQASVCETLAYVFSLAHYDVSVAHDSDAALALAANGTFDVALVGFHLKLANGAELCRRLREAATPRGRPLAVWVMSAAPTTDIAAKCREAGAVELLRKPFDCEALMRAIEQHCGTSLG